MFCKYFQNINKNNTLEINSNNNTPIIMNENHNTY